MTCRMMRLVALSALDNGRISLAVVTAASLVGVDCPHPSAHCGS